MCLRTTKIDILKFKKDHKDQDAIKVWKIYERTTQTVYSPSVGFYEKCYRLGGRHARTTYYPDTPGAVISKSGVVKSNRESNALNDDYPDYDRWFINTDVWHVIRGIHVYTTRNKAKQICEHELLNGVDYAIVCCHAQMKDFVGVDYELNTAVFVKVSISPRNYRKAIRGK